ncbi:uncharacterized protein V1518DRAFT_455783 [Limtongia smithiae]|uniref:uncharacterized protein n=1 Tax=Limtongia smithiae TaxID=1125753 RepID=UPI0034CDE89A
MGASQSTQAPASFLPSVPVHLSQDLVDSLEDSPDSDFSRSSDAAFKIETSVSAELEKVKEEAHTMLTAAWAKADAVPPAGPATLTSPGLLSDIDSFRTHIVARQNRLKERAEAGKKFGYEEPRAKLIQCLATNQTKPLMCLDEFNAFKDKLESTIN